MPVQAPSELPLLALRHDGRAFFNRQASRILPPDVVQVRLVQPTTPRTRWLLLPGLPGGHRVSARPDRLGYLRLTLRDMATQTFAVIPAGIRTLYFELVPNGKFFTLNRVVVSDDELPSDSLA